MNLKYFAILILLSNIGYSMPPAAQPAASNTATGATAATAIKTSAETTATTGQSISGAVNQQKIENRFLFTSSIINEGTQVILHQTLKDTSTGALIKIDVNFVNHCAKKEFPGTLIAYPNDISMEDFVFLMGKFMIGKETLAAHVFKKEDGHNQHAVGKVDFT